MARADLPDYPRPKGQLGLTGPVTRPAPGMLPLRGDMAHIALAGAHLAAHYVVPMRITVGASATELRLAPDAQSEIMQTLDPGTQLEALDYAGDWCWACFGPAGPSGYVAIDAITRGDGR